MDVYITKTHGDYTHRDRTRSGDFWKVEFDGSRWTVPGSRPRKSVVEMVRNNLGYNARVWLAV